MGISNGIDILGDLPNRAAQFVRVSIAFRVEVLASPGGEASFLIPHIAVTPELKQPLIVDNSMRLYWPEE